MTIRKEESQDCQVLEDGQVQVRTITRVFENDSGVDVLLGKSYHRKVIPPGKNPSKESQVIRDICAVVHTPLVVATFLVALAEAKLLALEDQRPTDNGTPEATEALARFTARFTEAERVLANARRELEALSQ